MKKRGKKETPHYSVRSVTPGDKLIGIRVRARRLEMHISQQELGEKVGVSFQQVQKYEKGTNRVGSLRLAQIADILDTNVAHFLGNLDGKNPKPSPVHAFLATRDGIDINEAMMKITSSELRRSVIDLARKIGRAYSGEAEA